VSCAEINFILLSSKTEMVNIRMSNGETYDSLYEQVQNIKWIYGNDVSWDGSKYTLISTIGSSPAEFNSEKSKIGQGYHYTCFTTEYSCSSVSYIYYTGSGSPYYINLSNGKTIDKAMEEMQTNTKNSAIKTTIDKWYEENMINYTKYLEDTVWCNDRSMGNSNGWTKDGNANNSLYYSFSIRRRPDINCSNKNDAFTVGEEHGNGALTYPVALLTGDEMILAGGGMGNSNDEYYLYTTNNYWGLSSYLFNYESVASVVQISYAGQLSEWNVGIFMGVRPSVSLISGTKLEGGDGTASDPYTLELD